MIDEPNPIKELDQSNSDAPESIPSDKDVTSHPRSDLGYGSESVSAAVSSQTESAPDNALSELEQLKRDAEIEQARKDALIEEARRDSFIGQVIARDNTIFKHIGEGQSSHIFTTRMVYTDAKNAVKILKKPDDTRKAIFRAAVRDMEDLDHANIVKTRFYIESRDGDPCSMMEYFESVPLSEVLHSIKKIQAERVIILILLQIAAALDYAHSKGVKHGHLTTRDVLTKDLVETIVVKVTDFGMTELKDHSVNSADWAYLSPERLKGAPVTELGDIFALGVIGYQMISGFPPYNEKEYKEGLDEEPLGLRAIRPDLKCGHELNQILRRAVEKNPAKRIQSMREFKTRLIEIGEMFEGKRSTTKKSHDTKLPDMPFLAHLNEIKGTTEEEPKEEKPKYKKRSRRQQITKTFTELVQLKNTLHNQEQLLAMRLAAAAAAGNQRRSPLSTASRLFATVIICGGIFSAALTYALTHTKQLSQMFTSASVQLHKALTPIEKPKPIEAAPNSMATRGTKNSSATKVPVPSQTSTVSTKAPISGQQPATPSTLTAGAQTNTPSAAAASTQTPPTLITPATIPQQSGSGCKYPGMADKDRELYKKFRERMSQKAY